MAIWYTKTSQCSDRVQAIDRTENAWASNLLGTIKTSQGRLDLGLYIVAGIAAVGAISVYLAYPKSRTSAASLLTVKVA